MAAARSANAIDSWSLTSLQQRLVKTGGRLVTHARYYWLLLAESHLTRRLFGGDAPADLGAPGADRLMENDGRRPFGRREAQRGRGVGELWAVAGSASGIQVAVAGVMRCDPGDQNIRAGESERV